MEISSQAVQGLGRGPQLTGNFCSNPKTPNQLGLLTRCNDQIYPLKEKNEGERGVRGTGERKGERRRKRHFPLV